MEIFLVQKSSTKNYCELLIFVVYIYEREAEMDYEVYMLGCGEKENII